MKVKKFDRIWNCKTNKKSYSKYNIEFIDFEGNKHIIKLDYNDYVCYNPFVDYTHNIEFPSKKGLIKFNKWIRIHRKRRELKYEV